MSKIIQIRRGTTAQNDKFTGMPGEVTFDTDAKTLRVHDGVKLGGYILARADAITSGGTTGGNSGGDFDITTVPDDFWTGLFERFAKTDGGCDCPPADDGDTFDIATVPDEFWTDLFERFSPKIDDSDANTGGLRVLEGLMAPLTVAPGIQMDSKEDITPYFAQLYLVCRTADAGYQVGDICTAFGVGNFCPPPVNIVKNDVGFSVLVYTQNQSFWILNKDTAEKTNAASSKWRLYARVYY